MIISLKIFLILFNIFTLNFCNYSFFKKYQLEGYNVFKLLKKLKPNYLFFAKILLLVFFNLSLLFTNNFYFVFFLDFTFLAINILFKFLDKKFTKNKLNFTKRFTRFFIFFNILLTSLLSFLSFYIKNPAVFKYVFINYLLIFYIIFIIAHILILPIENLIKIGYIKKAQQKIKKMPKLKIIAITGSFGKTSVKNYLYEMLKTKYKVCKSEKSFNTEMGITKIILNNLNFNDEILILEFGADHKHDIKKLCKIAKPFFGIITGVTNQHLETFKTMENLINTKFELIEFMNPKGCVVLNYDNQITKDFYGKAKIENKFLISLNNSNQNDDSISLWAKNVDCKFNKTNFVLCDKKNEIECSTNLLGKHNITNILLACKMALILGVNFDEIKNVIKHLSPTPHRLNLTQNCGKYILDDSFNANPEGVKYAVDVLKTFEGKKIVITPGLIELGDKQFEENVKLGFLLEDIDYVFIINQINKRAILKGLENSKNKVFCFDDLSTATQKLNEVFFEGDCVLFLNDLPDNYI